jgi:hypothetical protein
MKLPELPATKFGELRTYPFTDVEMQDYGKACYRQAILDANAELVTAAKQALQFTEFCWREVSLNDYAEQMREAAEKALRKALGETK